MGIQVFTLLQSSLSAPLTTNNSSVVRIGLGATIGRLANSRNSYQSRELTLQSAKFREFIRA